MERLEIRGRILGVVQRIAEEQARQVITLADGERAMAVEVDDIIPGIELEFGISIPAVVASEILSIDHCVDAVEKIVSQ